MKPTTKLMLLLVLMTGFDASTQEISLSPLVEIVTEQICNKQLVLLGELPSHGEALAFQAKAEIAQNLIENCGFNAIFFEAPVYDFYGFREIQLKKQGDANKLDRAIGGFWMTQELSPWRHWLFTQSIQENLFLAGLDDQVSRSSEFAKTTLPEWVAEVLEIPMATECQQAIERNFYWRYDNQHPFDDKEKQNLMRCSQMAADAVKGQSKTSLGKLKMLENLANLFSRQYSVAEALDRDVMMNRNFQWQFNELPKNSKIIIWTATVHAARQQGPLKQKPFGAWLTDQWGDRMATIGFTAFGGQSSMAGMASQQITDAEQNTLEAKLLKSAVDWHYFDKQELNELGLISSRLFGPFKTLEWDNYFDGVVVFKQEQAPTFNPK